jgi:guanylate kinase
MDNVKQEKMIITGPSGSGKDYLRKYVFERGLRYQPKFTTRPKRNGEIDGMDYQFLDYNLYVELQKKGEIKTHQSFVINNVNWYYGITNKNWTENQLFIMTPHEISQLKDVELKECFVVYLKIDDLTRKTRIMERNDSNDSVLRRIEADNEDFENFKKYDLCITDSEFDPEWIFDLMN